MKDCEIIYINCKIYFQLFSVECQLSDIVTASYNGLSLNLVNERKGRRTGNGTIILSYEEFDSCKDDIELQFMGKKLDKKDTFGSSDPFLQFSRTTEGGEFTVVHRTEYINNNCNPKWKKFTIPIRTLCNGDLDRNIKVECFDHNKNGSHSLIGEFYLTVRKLQQRPIQNASFDVIHQKKKVSKITLLVLVLINISFRVRRSRTRTQVRFI